MPQTPRRRLLDAPGQYDTQALRLVIYASAPMAVLAVPVEMYSPAWVPMAVL